jgi:nifR3 family TIM-barrel protein
MAGVTNPPFRRLCREFGGPGGLYVAEMVTSRAVVERNPRAMRIVQFDEDEGPKSAQVYGVDPATVGQAVAIITGETGANHIDLNFGCPVPKVTRKGGGGALPWKTNLFGAVVRAAVNNAPASVPVTVKIRIGIDDEHETFRDASQIAVAEGASAITLHARTVAQRYSGTADWTKIQELKAMDLGVPIFGNGDVFSGEDALAMLAETGCDGIAIGRGCLGRPWLFADIGATLSGSQYRVKPDLAEISNLILRHGQLLADYLGNESRAAKDMRKHIAWYLRGFAIGGETRRHLMLVSHLNELAEQLAALPNQPFPVAGEGPRGRMGGAKRPHLPDNWLASREVDESMLTELMGSELAGFGSEVTGG